MTTVIGNGNLAMDMQDLNIGNGDGGSQEN